MLNFKDKSHYFKKAIEAKRSQAVRLLYYLNGSCSELPELKLDSSYLVGIWKPSLFRIIPPGLAFDKWPYFIYMWIVHLGQTLKGDGYSIITIYHEGALIHYTGVAKRSMKYPFMKDEDVIIGPILTDEAHQRKGLAYHSIIYAIKLFAREGRKIWFVVREDNIQSRSLIEKCDFIPMRARCSKRYGINVFNIENEDAI